MKSFLKILSVFALTALLFSSCKPDDFYLQNAPELSVDRNEITVSSAGGIVEIQVQSTRRWVLTASEGDWFAITPVWLRDDDGNVLAFGGEDNGLIRVLIEPNEWAARHLRLELETAGGMFQQVDIRQAAGREMYLLFFESFGTAGTTAAPFPALADYTDFRREGAGGSEVVFRSEGGIVSLRSNSASPTPFSGSTNVHFSAQNGGFLFVENIETLGAGSLLISFATNQMSDSVSLDYSTDGETWRNLEFEKNTTTWGGVSVSITDLEAGVDTLSLRFTALPTTYGVRIDDIRVEGGDVPPGTRLTISPTAISVGYAEYMHSVSVTSNVAWTATTAYNWISFTDPAGSGNQLLDFMVTHNYERTPREGTITLRTNDDAVTRILRVTQAGEPVPTTLLFSETFGAPVAGTGSSTPSGHPFIEEFDGWVTTGAGASNVTFSRAGGVDLRTTQTSPNPPFSGQGNVFFATGSGSDRIFIISGIEPGSYTNFRLSFASQAEYTSLLVEYSVDDTAEWIGVPYTRTGTGWGLVTTYFYLPQAVSTLNLRFRVPAGTAGNFRIDDVQLSGYQD